MLLCKSKLPVTCSQHVPFLQDLLGYADCCVGSPKKWLLQFRYTFNAFVKRLFNEKTSYLWSDCFTSDNVFRNLNSSEFKVEACLRFSWNGFWHTQFWKCLLFENPPSSSPLNSALSLSKRKFIFFASPLLLEYEALLIWIERNQKIRIVFDQYSISCKRYSKVQNRWWHVRHSDSVPMLRNEYRPTSPNSAFAAGSQDCHL